MFVEATVIVLFMLEPFNSGLCPRTQFWFPVAAHLLLAPLLRLTLRNGGGSGSAKFPTDLLLSDSLT